VIVDEKVDLRALELRTVDVRSFLDKSF